MNHKQDIEDLQTSIERIGKMVETLISNPAAEAEVKAEFSRMFEKGKLTNMVVDSFKGGNFLKFLSIMEAHLKSEKEKLEAILRE